MKSSSKPLTLVQWSEDVVPTVAFNFRKIRKGSVTMKIWDVAGIRLFLLKYLSWASIVTAFQVNQNFVPCGSDIAMV